MGTGSFPGVKSGRGVALTTHPLLVPWLRKSRAKPLLPIWAVRPVQSLSACTRVHLTFTYTSTPPVDSTACTESQCLYKGAPYLYHLLTYGLDDPRFETRPRNFSKTSKQVLWPTEPHNQRVAELFYRGKTDGT